LFAPGKGIEDVRPLADAGREAVARQIFVTTITPEEYAARYAHTIMCSSFDDFRYSDPRFDSWIQELHVILRSPGKVDECRQKYLTPEELTAIQEQIQSDQF
jgi:hypothetical protein